MAEVLEGDGALADDEFADGDGGNPCGACGAGGAGGGGDAPLCAVDAEAVEVEEGELGPGPACVDLLDADVVVEFDAVYFEAVPADPCDGSDFEVVACGAGEDLGGGFEAEECE